MILEREDKKKSYLQRYFIYLIKTQIWHSSPTIRRKKTANKSRPRRAIFPDSLPLKVENPILRELLRIPG
jgi:hypothetical protein